MEHQGELSPYREGRIEAILASKGLVSVAENPYPIGSIEAREYARGWRDAQPNQAAGVMVPVLAVAVGV